MKNCKTPTPERLRAVLEAFGGDPERWPEDEREGLEKCLAENPELRTDFADARALDLLLGELGKIDDVKQSDFSQSSAVIMARIKKTNPDASGQAADGHSASSALYPEELETVVSLSPRPRGWSTWQTAGLLAASFAFGIYIGATLLAGPAVEGVAQLSGAQNPPAMEFTIFQSGAADFFEGDL